MTQMLASVTSLWEARMAQELGIDIVDCKDPSQGALGALPLSTVREIACYLAGQLPSSATLGDRCPPPAALCAAIMERAASGVTFVKVSWPSGAQRAEALASLKRAARRGARIVPVLFADVELRMTWLDEIADQGCVGAMLDTAHKDSGRLTDCLSRADLAQFVAAGRALGLMVGLAGSLRSTDIPRLVDLDPDFLGFRGALCAGGSRNEHLDPRAMLEVRALIPSKRPATGEDMLRRMG